jgi:hypothetical protein
MKAPACDPGNSCIALRAESRLFIPEIAKSAGTPKRFRHVSPFAFFEVGFIGWIVRVSFAFDLDVSFDGSALSVVQPDFIWPSFVIAGFTEEGPVTVPAPFNGLIDFLLARQSFQQLSGRNPACRRYRSWLRTADVDDPGTFRIGSRRSLQTSRI